MIDYSKFGPFLCEVEDVFFTDYGLKLEDVGLDDEDYLGLFERNETPQSIVDEYGKKYDLVLI